MEWESKKNNNNKFKKETKQEYSGRKEMKIRE